MSIEVCRYCPKKNDEDDCTGCHTYNTEKKNRKLEKEIKRLKEENLRMRNCENCKFSQWADDDGIWLCHKHENYVSDNDCPCGKWEIRK